MLQRWLTIALTFENNQYNKPTFFIQNKLVGIPAIQTHENSMAGYPRQRVPEAGHVAKFFSPAHNEQLLPYF